MASTVPNSFLTLIFISPVSLRCNLVRSRRLWSSEISILQWESGVNSSPSLYHWTLNGSRPINGILKVAFWLCLTTIGFANASISLTLNLGGSYHTHKQNKFKKVQTWTLEHLHMYWHKWADTNEQTFNSNHTFGFTPISLKSIFSRKFFCYFSDFQFMNHSLFTDSQTLSGGSNLQRNVKNSLHIHHIYHLSYYIYLWLLYTSLPSLDQTPLQSALLSLQTSSAASPTKTLQSSSPAEKWTPGSAGDLWTKLVINNSSTIFILLHDVWVVVHTH